ncbi:MAG: hypothetical protein KDA68_02290 [Planctomycetaceae bacterium]|nr:hypothetical protein [Planctomycetaceae bacterium]
MITSELWRDVRVYREEIRRVRETFPNPSVDGWGLVRQFSRWRTMQQAGRTPLDDELPWITLGGLEYLSGILRPTDRVFEWGSGGSTLYIASRVRELVTVEHDREWFERVQLRMQEKQRSNWMGFLEEPDSVESDTSRSAEVWSDYLSSDERYQKSSFENYAKRIDEYADGSFNLVSVDGRARPSCIHHAIPKVAPGGVLMLDNAERDYYAPACKEMIEGGWILRECQGPGPYIRYFWSTQFWQKPGTGVREGC